MKIDIFQLVRPTLTDLEDINGLSRSSTSLNQDCYSLTLNELREIAQKTCVLVMCDKHKPYDPSVISNNIIGFVVISPPIDNIKGGLTGLASDILVDMNYGHVVIEKFLEAILAKAQELAITQLELRLDGLNNVEFGGEHLRSMALFTITSSIVSEKDRLKWAFRIELAKPLSS